MADGFRIQADEAYLQALGRAFYNFTYLEWVVIWTIVKLSADGFDSVPKGKTASHIAAALMRVIDSTLPPLSSNLRRELAQFHAAYLAAIKSRNKLLHAHPYTAQGGIQQLGGGGIEWPLEEVLDGAKQFEETAISGNTIFYGALKSERP